MPGNRFKRVVLAAFVVLLLGFPIGYAVGQLGSEQADPAGPVPTHPTTPAAPDAREVAYATEGAPPERVEACRRDIGAMGDELICEMLLAVDDGRLEPGAYSRAEIEEQREARAGQGD